MLTLKSRGVDFVIYARFGGGGLRYTRKGFTLNILRLSTLAIALFGTLAVGCDDGSSDDTDASVADATTSSGDAGSSDAGSSDAATQADAGSTDASAPDSGAPDSGAPVETCVVGTEGCPCNSSATAFPMAQDDCGEGMLCMNWAAVRNENVSIGDAVSTCIRPCAADADCGDGRSCAQVRNTQSTSYRMCVDSLARNDRFCGLSRNLESMVAGDTGGTNTGTRMVGCKDSACETGIFSDLTPDEGVCMAFCSGDADCAEMSDGNTFCSTLRFGTGVCTTHNDSLNVGDICKLDPGSKFSLGAYCGNDSTRCFPIGNWGVVQSYGDYGVCIPLADNAAGCAAGKTFSAVFSDNSGFCHDACAGNPGACSASTSCVDWNITAGVSTCLNRRTPALSLPAPEATQTSSSSYRFQQMNQGEAENCYADMLALTSCPSGTDCLHLANTSEGYCVYTCDSSAGTACAATYEYAGTTYNSVCTTMNFCAIPVD